MNDLPDDCVKDITEYTDIEDLCNLAMASLSSSFIPILVNRLRQHKEYMLIIVDKDDHEIDVVRKIIAKNIYHATHLLLELSNMFNVFDFELSTGLLTFTSANWYGVHNMNEFGYETEIEIQNAMENMTLNNHVIQYIFTKYTDKELYEMIHGHYGISGVYKYYIVSINDTSFIDEFNE